MFATLTMIYFRSIAFPGMQSLYMNKSRVSMNDSQVYSRQGGFTPCYVAIIIIWRCARALPN